MRQKIKWTFVTLLLTAITLFLYIENQSCFVISSSIYENPEQIDVVLYVQLNTFFDINNEEISKEIISEHQKINGEVEKGYYTLCLYRTGWHYRMNWEYDKIICDKNGAIICCEENY